MKHVVASFAFLLTLSSSALADSVVVFNEIMYHPTSGSEASLEWVELHNQNAVDVDLTGWSLNGGIQYVFPTGTRIKGRGYLVVASNPTALAAEGPTDALGPFNGHLGNTGERLELWEGNNRVMDSVKYGADVSWPVAPDGAGVSLAKRDPNLASTLAENWTSSGEIGGSPGRRNFPASVFEAPAGLVSYWNFDEASGVAMDLAGGNPGSLSVAATRTSGLVGAGAVQFSGSPGAVISLGRGTTNSLSAESGIALEAVLKPGWNGTDRATIFRKEQDNRGTLVSYWSFDEADRGTNAALDVVSGNGGVFKGTATRTNGLVGQGGLFLRNNGTEGLNVGTGVSGSLSFTSGFTVAAWIQPQWAGVSNTYDAIFSKDDGPNRITFTFQYDAGNSAGLVAVPPGPVLALGLNIAGAYTELDMPLDGALGRPTLDQLKDGGSHLVAGSFDAASGELALWIDGTRRYSANKPGVIKSGGIVPAYIGNRSTAGGQPFTGVIDDVAIWSSALTSVQMARLASKVAATDLLPITGPGNRVQFGFRRSGDTDFTDPVVTSTPVLFFGVKIGGSYRELELPLDGLEGRPSLASLKDERRHHVAAGYSLATRAQTIAIDGQVLASRVIDGPLDVGGIGQAFIGNIGLAGAEPFKGILDEVAFWRRALTASELATHARQVSAGRNYFAPSNLDLPTIAINELSAASATPAFVELANFGEASLDVGGLVIARASGGSYTLPSQILAPGGLVSIPQSVSGIRPKAGDLMVLYASGGSAVLDAVRAGVSAQARLSADSGAGEWRVPKTSTPGAGNTFQLHDEVVINEIFYRAPPTYSTATEYTNTTLVPIESIWSYDQSGNDLGTEWKDTSYNDTAWPTGPALFFNETAVLPATKNTPLNLGPITHYFRTHFTLPVDPSLVTLNLRTVVDDGAVVYLNGVEIYRVNVKANPVIYTSLASTTVANATFQGPFTVPISSLVEGVNLLAVELHQAPANSDDAVFGLELNARILSRPSSPFAANSEQWVEVFNRSSNVVDLAGWKFDSGMNFVFSSGSTLAPGGYLVIASDPVALQQKYPALHPLGPWTGKLSSTDRLVLKDAAGNPADVVRYYNGGEWPDAANAGGSSLELRDPLADNSKAGAWAASDEGRKSAWQTITYRGTGFQRFTTPGDAQYQELVLGLLDTGEVLLDDITVKDLTVNAGASIIQNSDFETGIGKWRVIGNHKGEWTIDPEDASNHVMRMVATGMTEHMNNHAETTLKDGAKFVTLNDAHQYEISLRARWMSGSPQLNSRLFFNRMPKTTILAMPNKWGTPGAANSRLVTNLGPTFATLRHEPAVPPANQPVRVSVSAQDPQTVASCTLWWSTNSIDWSSSAMSLGSDERYFATIPGYPTGRTVQFYVEAVDARGAVSAYPADGAGSRALYQVDDGQAILSLAHNIRIVMTAKDTNLLLTRTNLMSNDRIGCTVIYDETEVTYDCGVRLKGSEHGRPQPVRIGFNLEFPAEHLFRGEHSTVALDRSGGGNRFGQDEILINHIVYRAGGVPAFHNDLVREIGPQGQFTGGAILQMSRYNPIFLDSQYDHGGNNPVFEVEYYYGQSEQIPSGAEGLKVPQEAGVTGNQLGDLGDDKENYRLGYIIKNARDKDDFETMIPYAKMFSLTGSSFISAAEQKLDVDEWLRCFALGQLCGAGDNYSGDGSGHNVQIFVRPSDGKLVHFLWDMDFAFTRGATDSLESNGDLAKLLGNPAYRHAYYAHIQDIVETTYNTNYMAYWTDHYDNFTPGQDFSGFLTYIKDRSNYARTQLPKQVSFGITSNGGQPFVTNSPLALIAGRAWVDVKDIQVAGAVGISALTWTTWTNFVATVPLLLGSNVVVLNAYHRTGRFLTNATITVISSSPSGGVDTDGDGMPDAWENIHDFNALVPDASADADHDGFTNLEEYLAGTDPRDAGSRLRIDSVQRDSSQTRILFAAITGRSYSVQYREALDGSPWQTLTSVPAGIADQSAVAIDPSTTRHQRFYRLVTPAQ